MHDTTTDTPAQRDADETRSTVTHTVTTIPGIEAAREWVRTDPGACRDDVERLGSIGEAASYQLQLIEDRRLAGDNRWAATTADAMIAALEELL